MVRVEIVRFREGDIPFGKKLTDAEAWGRSDSDWRRLVRLEPEGFFKSLVDGSDAGTAAVLVYPEVAWIHSVIVDGGFRRAGVGTALMEACLSYARERGISSVKLDAVSQYSGLYRKFGFREEFISNRFSARASSGARPDLPPGELDVNEVCRFDCEVTGIDRSAVLRDIMADDRCGGSVMREGGRVTGYVLWRPGEPMFALGPCVVEPGRSLVARELMNEALHSAAGARCRICVPSYNEASLGIVKSLGAEESRPSVRMCLGPEVRESKACYAMIGPELG